MRSEIPHGKHQMTISNDERKLPAHHGPYGSRFYLRHEDESDLLGVSYTPAEIMTAAHHQVEAE